MWSKLTFGQAAALQSHQRRVGNHEGSMVLWIQILTLFGAAWRCSAPSFGLLSARVLAVMGALGVAFCLFPSR